MPPTEDGLSLRNRRKLEMADTLFRVTENRDVPAIEIVNLIGHFRALLGVEEKLPQDTRLMPLRRMAFDDSMIAVDGSEMYEVGPNFKSERTGNFVGALECALKGAEDQSTESRTTYEDTCRELGKYSGMQLANATRLHVKVGSIMRVMPRELFNDQELFDAFMNEVALWDGELSDENKLISVALNFTHSCDRSDIAQRILENFPYVRKSEFIMHNFDWIFKGASDDWIISAILDIQEIQNDQQGMDKLLKIIAKSKGLERLIDRVRTHSEGEASMHSKELICKIIEWALSNTSFVKYDSDIAYMAYVGNDEQFPKVLRELEKRQSWRNIAYVRTCCHGIDKRHQAAEILDRNVDNIPVAIDIVPALYKIDPDSECGPSVFALIGTIGMNEQARLRAVERIATEDNSKYGDGWRILAEIMNGHPRYRNATVEAAAREALRGMNALHLAEGRLK